MSAKEAVVILVIVALALGGVGGYVIFVKLPMEGPTAAPTQRDVESRPAPAAREGGKENDYSPLWETITRPPAPQPTQPAPVKPTVTFCLKGIVSQGTARMAIIEDPTGRQRLVGEGGVIDGARVTKISSRSVTLEADGKTTVLQLKPKTEPARNGAKAQ